MVRQTKDPVNKDITHKKIMCLYNRSQAVPVTGGTFHVRPKRLTVVPLPFSHRWETLLTLYHYHPAFSLTSPTLFVDCLTSQQHVSVSPGQICLDNCMCCHTQIEVADPTFCLTQSQYTDTGPTSPSSDPVTKGALQGSH